MNSLLQYLVTFKMDSILIYDIQSQATSENGDQPHKFHTVFKKEQKETEISDIPQSKFITVRPYIPQQIVEKKSKQAIKQQDNIIFYEEDLGKSTSSMDYDQSHRCFLKNQQSASSSDGSEAYDDVDELQESQQVQKIEKQKKIIPQQIKLKNQTVIVRANAELFVRQLVPINYRITCVIQIQRNLLGFPTYFRLFLQQPYQYLLSAKKQTLKYYSSFIISKHPRQIHKRTNIYMGRLQGNFIGTEYSLFTVKDRFQTLKLVVNYEKNIIGFNGPRSFIAQKLNPEIKSNNKNSFSDVLERAQQSKLLKLETAKPIIKKGKFRIDFDGKIKLPSAKNFILQYLKQQKRKQCLLFGKIQDNKYIMEVQYPLTVLEGFGICLTSLDSKLMVN